MTGVRSQQLGPHEAGRYLDVQRKRSILHGAPNPCGIDGLVRSELLGFLQQNIVGLAIYWVRLLHMQR